MAIERPDWSIRGEKRPSLRERRPARQREGLRVHTALDPTALGGLVDRARQQAEDKTLSLQKQMMARLEESTLEAVADSQQLVGIRALRATLDDPPGLVQPPPPASAADAAPRSRSFFAAAEVSVKESRTAGERPPVGRATPLAPPAPRDVRDREDDWYRLTARALFRVVVAPVIVGVEVVTALFAAVFGILRATGDVLRITCQMVADAFSRLAARWRTAPPTEGPAASAEAGLESTNEVHIEVAVGLGVELDEAAPKRASAPPSPTASPAAPLP